MHPKWKKIEPPHPSPLLEGVGGWVGLDPCSPPALRPCRQAHICSEYPPLETHVWVLDRVCLRP